MDKFEVILLPGGKFFFNLLPGGNFLKQYCYQVESFFLVFFQVDCLFLIFTRWTNLKQFYYQVDSFFYNLLSGGQFSKQYCYWMDSFLLICLIPGRQICESNIVTRWIVFFLPIFTMWTVYS